MANERSRKRGRSTQILKVGPSTAEAAPASHEAKRSEPTPPIPAARPVVPLFLKVAAYLKVAPDDIRLYEAGGSDIDVKTADGQSHRVPRLAVAG